MFSKAYWEDRYKEQQTGWDIGHTSPPLKAYFDQLTDQHLKILIPGAGNAYEAIYLHENNFMHVHVLDIAKQPIDQLQIKTPSFPKEQLINSNFFEHQGQYDLIVEQTFFCALPPEKREAYAVKMHELLKPSGKLVGLLFDVDQFPHTPPFGGNEKLYRNLFEEHFSVNKMERAHNSIHARQGKELFINLSPRKI